MNSLPRFFTVALVACLLILPACLNGKPEYSGGQPTSFEHVAIASDHPAATRIGLEIMRRGGNAFDAAVAVQFALAVAYPGAGNIGGGGFAVLRTAAGEIAALDFRETAPLTAQRDMYLDPDGDVVPGVSLLGHLAVGVPGSVDGMVQLHQRFGQLEWQDVVQPAVDLARQGFRLTRRQAEKFNFHRDKLAGQNRSPIPVVRNDRPWQNGDIVVQDSLASTLERIRDRGRAGFYAGVTARYLIAEMQSGGGLIIQDDLDRYRSVWRQPVAGHYRGYRVVSMPPPSSGGVALLQMLYGLEAWPISKWKPDDWRRLHVKTEVERIVYADRAVHLGDPDYYPVPTAVLLSDGYLQRRFANISLQYRLPFASVNAGTVAPPESPETTHFSVVDRQGNAVSITTTLNGSFGAKVMVAGAGFFLNNEMDDFSSKPGMPNQFGLVGAEANAIEPGKRMLSSMTPTIVEKEGKLFLVVGSPGGSTIITTVAQVISNVIDQEMALDDAVTAARVHHQWLPDVIYHEPGAIGLETLVELGNLGHEFKERKSLGRVNAIMVLPDGKRVGVHDSSRGDGLADGY